MVGALAMPAVCGCNLRFVGCLPASKDAMVRLLLAFAT